jgi:DNA helicase-2/ATP-dependent DNA helicase PcrA
MELIDKLDHNSPIKPWGDNYFYQKDLLRDIQTLKRENISPKKLLDLINNQKEFLKKSKDLFLKLKSAPKETEEIFNKILKFADSEILNYLQFKKIQFDQGVFNSGKAKNPLINFKNALLKFYLDLEKQTPKQFELQKIYKQYQEKLTEIARYDYEDQILFAIQSFNQDADLLFDYQEKYQYILVDEYQDANSSQNEILNLLTKNDDIPNLFVVGDDDQSIFRFQGANLENIYEFVQKYQPKVITLNNNYRSHQTILDSSQCVIEKNKNRISSYLNNIDKSLKSALKESAQPITLFSSATRLEENYFVAQKIKELLDNKVSPKEIAVIYRNNTDVSDLLPLLEKLHIKYTLSSGNNILTDVKIKQLITLLKYINNPRNELLFPILAFDFIGLKEKELYNFYKHGKTCKKIKKFEKRIAKAKIYLENYNLNKAFNKIIRKFKILKKIIKDKNYETLQKFNAFYDHLKNLSYEKNINLTDFIYRLDLYIENNIPLEIESDITLNDSINLMTVHKAKGLEFEYVFVLNLVSTRWGEGRDRNILPLPFGILKYEINKDLDDLSEEDRRLFYVALTRAKKDLFLSYGSSNPSQFISEIKCELINPLISTPEIAQEALLFNFQKYPKIISDSDFYNYLKIYLKDNYVLSPTNLNSYLKCPLCFFYKTILKIPQTKNKYASYGTAVHAALSDLIKEKLSKNKFLLSFEKHLKQENLIDKDFKNLLANGLEELSFYFDKYLDTFDTESLSEFSFKPLNVHLDNIPITGNIDKIEIQKDKTAIAFDFKTGNPDNRDNDADYQRQILFYKILADNCPQFKYKINSGILDYIKKTKRKNIEIKEKDLSDLKILIKDIYNKILNLEFNQIGEKCKDENHIHQFKKI